MHSPSGSRSLPSNTIANSRGDFKAITTQSGVAYEGPSIPPTSSLLKEVERELEATKHKMQSTSLESTAHVQPLKKLSLLELTPTHMSLELANRLVAYLVGVVEDVFVELGKSYFLVDFVVVDYDIDSRVPLILWRPFLRTAQTLIDVYGEELTLRVNDEAIMFKVRHISRYFHSSTSGNPTPLDHIIATSSPSFIPFEGSDFIFKEIETFLHLSLNLPLMKNEDLKKVYVTMRNPSIEEPPKLKPKDLPSHLEYAFLEGTDNIPIIISKELKDKEKAALLKVLKLHKQAIAWKIFDIKGIDLCFCTHKILIEDDFKPAVQHQRRVNLKIHEVIKMEVIKLLDTRLIYSIFDSLWVSPVHYVPKRMK
nr:hypothetical protein [Tanacetum cinerariifolium]